jgi:hypothetical protein
VGPLEWELSFRYLSYSEIQFLRSGRAHTRMARRYQSGQGVLVEADHRRGPTIAVQSLADSTRESYGSRLYALERYAYIQGGLCTLLVDHDTIYGFVLSLTGSIGHKTILQMLTAI